MNPPALRHLDHPLARVAYVDVGPDRADHQSTLLFIHGALCAHGDWAPSIDHFSARHRCVALDLPGHGASPAGPEAIGIGPYARIVRDLAAALDLRDVVLVAHSMGCRVALQAAVGFEPSDASASAAHRVHTAHPTDHREAANAPTVDASPRADRPEPWPSLRGLVLVDGAYLSPRLLTDETPAQRRALADAARERAAALYADQAPAERAARGFGQMFFDARFHDVRDRLIARARALPPELARTLMPDFAGWDVEHMEAVLPRVAVPVLALACTFMTSAHERVRLQADTRTPWLDALQRHVSEVEIARIPGAGHFPMLEQPEATHALIATWLRQRGQSAGEPAVVPANHARAQGMAP
jgi:pimeloyl-ACP methyl ester carboxylesterase